jgi:hypothetical protein
VHVRNILIPTAILLAPAALPAAPASATASASATAVLHANQACYLVGERVAIAGSGFPPSRSFVVAVGGVDFGMGTTDANGDFTASLIPGGLGANIVQAVHVLSADDGTSLIGTTFTVTRTTGARILASTGTAASLRAPFQVWGFGLVHDKPPAYVSGPVRVALYVHYLSPGKRLKTTIPLGRTGGQCGYLRTPLRHVFPFAPSRGSWTLQVDSSPTYSAHPMGPVARIKVGVS